MCGNKYDKNNLKRTHGRTLGRHNSDRTIVNGKIIFLALALMIPMSSVAEGGLDAIKTGLVIGGVIIGIFLVSDLITLLFYFLRRKKRHALILFILGSFLLLFQIWRMYGTGPIEKTTTDYLVLIWGVFNILIPIFIRPIK